MGTPNALTPAAAMEVKRLYSLVDERGRRLHSQMAIADMLGVSETTVFRVLRKRAAYQNIRALPTNEEALASQAKVLAMLAEESSVTEVPAPAAPTALMTQKTLDHAEALLGYKPRSAPDAGY